MGEQSEFRGAWGTFTALALGLDIPAILREGALGALGGRLDFSYDASTRWKRGLDIPLKVNQMGHDVLSVVALGDGPSRLGQGPKVAVSYCVWACVGERPDLPNAGLQLPFTKDGMYRVEPPQTFSACESVPASGSRAPAR